MERNLMSVLFLILIIITAGIAGCIKFPEGPGGTEPRSAATAFCREQGGQTILIETPDGTTGFCDLSERGVCEVNALFASGGRDCVHLGENESFWLARKFVENSPTYRFDGYGITHKETVQMRCPYCWRFVFGFTSSHAGYGNRTGKMLAQVITPHSAEISVFRGRVTSAILDGKWDMIKQKFLAGTNRTENI